MTESKFMSEPGTTRLIQQIKSMPDQLTIGYDESDGLHVIDGSITSDKLANGAVTTDKIADGAVTNDQIADGAIDSTDIGDLASLRGAMGLGNTLGPLPIANGGTGASTAGQAIENLGLEEYILDLINTSGNGGEMKPYLMASMSQDRSDVAEGSRYYCSIDGHGFSAAIFRSDNTTSCDITSSVPGKYIISSSHTDWNETWNVSSVPATKKLSVKESLSTVAVSIYPA